MGYSWKDGIILKLANIVVYFVFLGSNIRSISFYDSVGGKLTYITPAPWSFLIWSLIHFLLLGPIVYQFTENGHRTIIEGISWRFPFVAVLNALYVHAWTRGYLITAFILSLFVSSVISHIYYIVKKHHEPSNTWDELCVHLPFSLWHGWATALVVLSAFTAFGVDASEYRAGVWTCVFVILALIFLGCTATAYAFSSPEGDLPASVVITWYLWAVFVQQWNVPILRWMVLAIAVHASLWVGSCVVAVVAKIRRGRQAILLDEEREPFAEEDA
ncbi:hypothetical protein BDY19DRAFT_1093435 [Irpex rosettiformis]|uniref:Uncharacterized protein n=1 Tax=Irpex rosettiformis TaxID=378272 RepID=A0ACB8TWH3_9APHY|nr:hypothetical protein BDY19DRAFT_1093435 [Irpex rosettiformis]